MLFKQLTLQDAFRGRNCERKREREISLDVSISKQRTCDDDEIHEGQEKVEASKGTESDGNGNKENSPLSPEAERRPSSSSAENGLASLAEEAEIKEEEKKEDDAPPEPETTEKKKKNDDEDNDDDDELKSGAVEVKGEDLGACDIKTETGVEALRERERLLLESIDPQGARLLLAYSTFCEGVSGAAGGSRNDRSRLQCVDLWERGILQECLRRPREEDPLVGKRVRVHWPIDDAWYPGEIESRCENGEKNKGEEEEATKEEKEKEANYRVRYEDKSLEELNLRQETIRLELPPMQPPASLLLSATAISGRKKKEEGEEEGSSESEAKPEVGAEEVPMHIDSPLSESEKKKKKQTGSDSGSASAAVELLRFCGREVVEQGNVIWAKMKGYPPWPALIITPEEAMVSSPEVFKGGSCVSDRMNKVCFRFFGAYNHGATQKPTEERLQKEIDPNLILSADEKPDMHKIASRPYDMWDWRVGVRLHFHLKYKLAAFKRAVAEAEGYLLENEMPDAMIPAYNDNTLLDDDDDDTIGLSSSKKGAKGRKGGKKGVSPVEFLRSFKVGKYLQVQDIGAIETEDERFHDERFLYPLGFKSVRTVQTPSGDDTEVSCSITRYEKSSGGGPAFTVTTRSVVVKTIQNDPKGDDEVANNNDSSKQNNFAVVSFTERSAQKAWQRLADDGCIKRQVYSGHKLFGYSVLKVQKVIERLQGSEWCHMYSPLDEDRWKKTILSRKKKIEAEAEAKAKEEKVLQKRKMWHAIAQCPKSLGFDPVMIPNQQPNRCAVCNSVKDTDFNELIQCDSCKVLVHAGCYGIEGKHDGTSVWKCSVCSLYGNDDGKEGEEEEEATTATATERATDVDVLSRPACALCPCVSPFQAMKPTEDNAYAHVTCAIWIPETHISPSLCQICGVKKIRPARLALKCDICKVQRGPCIQCSDKKCFASAHPLCARAKGWEMKMLEDTDGGVTLKAFCLTHSKQASSNTTGRSVIKSNAAERQTLTPNQEEEEVGGFEAGREHTTATPALASEEDMNTNSRLFCARTLPYQGVNHLEGSSDGHVPMRTKSSSKASIPYLVTGARSSNRLRLRLDNFKFGGRKRDVAPQRLVPPVSSVKDRLEWTRQTAHVRLAAGRSSIHGWGAFTRLRHHPGDFVIEYVGEVISLQMANQREKDYSKSVVGIGTYMFATSNKSVIDATAAGNMAHLINHSCDPNCFSRVVLCEGKYRVVISALRKIQPGEELTYDYRFSGDETLICHCGSNKCRGTVNIHNTNEEEEDTLL